MRSSRPTSALERVIAAIVLTVAPMLVPMSAQADPKIISCKDASGRVVYGNARPRECSLPSDIELEQAREQAAQQAAAEQARKDADRLNKQLVRRYPNAAALQAAREDDLAMFYKRQSDSKARLAQFAEDRWKIDAELEFYRSHKVPPDVQRRVDDNEAQTAAERSVAEGSQHAIDGINQKYDELLVKLKVLWAMQS